MRAPLIKKVQADPQISPTLTALLGIVTRKKGAVRLVHTPQDVKITVQARAVPLLTWNGGENARGTTFCVQKKTPDAADFVIVGVTSKTRFRDNKAVPGQQALYRVFAQRGDRNSLPSTIVIVYGG